MIKVKIFNDKIDILTAQEIRRQVFQIEQGINSELDFDGKDDNSEHAIAYFEDKAVGTMRIRHISGDTVKFERLAVLKEYRKNGVGSEIMNYTIEYLRDKGIKDIILDSQVHAKNFYEQLGFKQEREAFEEVGIPHVKMKIELK